LREGCGQFSPVKKRRHDKASAATRPLTWLIGYKQALAFPKLVFQIAKQRSVRLRLRRTERAWQYHQLRINRQGGSQQCFARLGVLLGVQNFYQEDETLCGAKRTISVLGTRIEKEERRRHHQVRQKQSGNYDDGNLRPDPAAEQR
jgi:hypothetical protein